MSIAGTKINLTTTPEGIDKISQTEKVTSPYFSGGDTTILGANLKTSSNLSADNKKYFFGIAHADTLSTEEFNVTFGSLNGYGANVEAGTKSETEAIYRQYANILLAPTEVTGGFVISSGGSAGQVTGRDDEIYVLSARRTNMKDRINKGTWQIALSGSTSAAKGVVGSGAAAALHLKDDSVNDSPTSTPVGDRYNIVSCSAAGTIVAESTVRNFGYFYPDMGIMVFSAAELSASIPGAFEEVGGVVQYESSSQAGLGYYKGTSLDTNTALRFVNCLQPLGTSMKFRDEEDQVSAQYFCRIHSGQMNFSNNPTFVSGSMNELRNTLMKSNPQTFITQVQLFNDKQDLVAVGNLSTPLKKNFTTEATIKVKLTY